MSRRTAQWVWSQFAFVDVLVEQEEGDTLRREEPQYFNPANVVPTCWECRLRGTNIKEYAYGRVTSVTVPT
eukprot:2276992-Amphidinium_carterae.1